MIRILADPEASLHYVIMDAPGFQCGGTRRIKALQAGLLSVGS